MTEMIAVSSVACGKAFRPPHDCPRKKRNEWSYVACGPAVTSGGLAPSGGKGRRQTLPSAPDTQARIAVPSSSTEQGAVVSKREFPISRRAGSGTSGPSPIEPGPAIADPRVAAALAWCQRRRIGGLTLAAPFVLDSGTQRALGEQPEIESLVVGSDPRGDLSPERLGVFLPEHYTWRLPPRTGRHILYIGTRSTITARMIKSALRRRVRSIVCWEVNDWFQWSLMSLALAKIRSKLASALQLSFEAIPRLAVWPQFRQMSLPSPSRRGSEASAPLTSDRSGAPRSSFVSRSIDSHYDKVLRRTLSLAPPAGPVHPKPYPGRVVFACPTLVAGGAERQIVNTAIGLRARGVREIVVLVTQLHSPPGNDFFLRHLVEAGVTVREVGSPVDTVAGWRRQNSVGAPTAGPHEIIKLLRALPTELLQDVTDLLMALRELRPAVVHSWLDHSNVRAGYAALLAGVPRIILSGRNVSPIHFPYIHEPFMRSTYRLLAARPQVRLVNNSQGGAQDYASWLGLPLAQFRVVYNGVNLAKATRAAPAAIADFRARLGIHADATLIGGMFRFSDEKRPLTWLEVAAEVSAARPQTSFLLFGQGPLKTAMEQYLTKCRLRDRIRIAPPTRENILALSAFDVLLLSSRWEGTPNVAIEAQAVGTPVVAAGGGGVSESLRPDVTGYFVESGLACDLAVSVIALADDPGKRSAMGAAGPAFVHQRFLLERMIEDTISLYGAELSEMVDA